MKKLKAIISVAIIFFCLNSTKTPGHSATIVPQHLIQLIFNLEE
jgi:hypothetical protein